MPHYAQFAERIYRHGVNGVNTLSIIFTPRGVCILRFPVRFIKICPKLVLKRRAKPRELERSHQVALIKWVRTVKDTYPVLKLLYAVPNGGDRNLRVARKLKAEGVLAGVDDLCLPAARCGYQGLYIDMKSEEGAATEEQQEFLRGVSGRGIKINLGGPNENDRRGAKSSQVVKTINSSGRKRERHNNKEEMVHDNCCPKKQID
jgi:hypothetical protein